MKKFFKIILFFMVGVVVLLVAGSVLLRIYLPPEKAKAMVLQRLSAQLKREVSLGTVSVGLLSGLQMNQLKISESPTFAKGTFLSSEQFSLKVALPPLIFRKVIVRQIILKSPQVMIVRYADGKTFNFSDLTGSTTAAAPVPDDKKEGPPFLLLVSRAEIQNGVVQFRDHSPAQQNIDIAGLDLKLKNVSLTSPFSVQTSFHAKSKGADLAVNFGGEANLINGSFQIKQGSIMSRDTKIILSGDLSRLKTPEPAVDLNVEIPQVDLANLAPFVTLPPDLHVVGKWNGKATVIGDQKSMMLDAELDGSKTKIVYGTSFAKPEKVPLTFGLTGTLKNMQNLDLQKLKVVCGSLVLSGKGQIRNVMGAQPALNTHFETNSFAIEEMLSYAPNALPKDLTLKGPNKLSADVSGTPANIQFAAKWDGVNMAVTKADQFAKPAGMAFDVTAIGNRPSPDKVVFSNLSAHLGPNLMTGAGAYETKGTKSNINFNFKGKQWSVAETAKVSPLLAPYHPTGTLSFDATAIGPVEAPQTTLQTSADVTLATVKHEYYEGQNLQLKWNLSQVTPDLAKIAGTASLKQGPGKILNMEKLAESIAIGHLLLMPLDILAKLQKKGVLSQVPLPSFQTIPFDALTGDYLLRAGTMEIKSFELLGKDLSYSNRGTIGLAGAQALNINNTIKLAPGSLGGTLGAILKDEEGRPTVKFGVTGSVADPKVKWEMQEAGKKALQQAGEELMKNKQVQDAVGDVQKALKGIFNK